MSMNDEWSRCPICFEDYSSTHRPTTFACGHSICINHTLGNNRLRYCPICRHPLKQGDTYHVSYNLEEAARLFQLIKNTIDWTTIKFPPQLIVNHDQNNTLEMSNPDEIYARQLQAQFNREILNEPPQRIQISRENQAVSTNQITNGLTALTRDRSRGHQKRCGHGCDLVSTGQCCICSDRRPQLFNSGYETYIDGQGMVNQAARNAFYCSTCKRR